MLDTEAQTDANILASKKHQKKKIHQRAVQQGKKQTTKTLEVAQRPGK